MSSSKTRVGLLFVITLFLMAFSTLAYADDKDGHGRKACKADVEQFCPQEKPGEGRILACLKEHRSQLQATCQEKLPMMEKSQQMKQSCQADRKKFCPEAEGKKAARACMKKNHDLLSEPCRAAITELKSWRQSHPSNHPSPQSSPAAPPKTAPSATLWDSLRNAAS